MSHANLNNFTTFFLPTQWLSGIVVASHAGDRAGDRSSIPGRDRPKSLEQVVTDPLANARQKVWVSWVFGDDNFKQMQSVTVGVAR